MKTALTRPSQLRHSTFAPMIAVAYATATLFSSVCAYGQTSEQPKAVINPEALEKTEKIHRFRLFFSGEPGRLSGPGANVNGLGVGLALQYGLGQKWAGVMAVRQSFGLNSSRTALYTGFDGRIIYALSGSILKSSQSVRIDGVKVLDAAPKFEGGYRIFFAMNQYFVNTSNTAVPTAGPGLGAYYETQSPTDKNWFYGFRYDMTGNGVKDIKFMHLFFGMALGL
jgi:hypothetical protein